MLRALMRLVVVIVLLCGAAILWAELRYGEIPPLAEAPAPDPALVDQGAMLAQVGGCASCHGEDLAGGAALPTPFGTLYASNITPDMDSGIGTWSAEAFRRAMRHGVDREGRYLYPAFPYDSFTHATDADLDALYAYLRTVPPVSRAATPDALRFPFNMRVLVAGWQVLYLRPGPFEPDPDRDDTWNRGAYLATGLGHCEACHTPRNRFGAMDGSARYGGAMVEGWWSPALNASGTSPIGWSEDELINYLYDGWDENHGIAAGPMGEVVANISALPETDMTALATYIAAQAPVPDDAARQDQRDAAAGRALAAGETPGTTGDPVLDHGAQVFVERCANCHRSGSETVPLALATAVTGPHPENFLRVVLFGVTPTENAYFVRPMPGFAQLPDEDISDLAAYVRAQFADGPDWQVTPDMVGTLRQDTGEN